MKLIFNNTYYFTYLYIAIFLIDSFVKVVYPSSLFRYLTKALLIIVLLYYFILNKPKSNSRNNKLMIYAIYGFLVGDAFITASRISSYFLAPGVVCFAFSKILYSIRFSNKKDFNIIKLLPFLLFCFSYMCLVMVVIFNSLGNYFIPVLLYLFIVMLTAQFAYLRRYEVNKRSYILVLIGVIFSMFSDSITLLKEFYDYNIAYNQYTIMLFYALSQYFIIIGITKEKIVNNDIIP